MRYRIRGAEKPIFFNPKNSQFRALYLAAFAQGYEPQTTALINLIVPEHGVFYDIGSNWGWFSLSVMARPGFAGKVHAFEPFEPSFKDLRSVVAQAGLQDRIHCHPIALGDHPGEGVMRLPDHLQSGLAVVDEKAPKDNRAVQIATLDSLSLEPPSVLKVDVEGAEAEVFRGASDVLRKHTPMIVFENSRFGNEAHSLAPLLLLHDLGYTLYRLAWLRKSNQISYLIGDDEDRNPQSVEKLALVEFEAGERFLLPDSLNLFACHREKTFELEKYFQPVGDGFSYLRP